MPKKANRRRSWDSIIARLNDSISGKITIDMGSTGSAQVTRVRLLQTYDNLSARTEGRRIHVALDA